MTDDFKKRDEPGPPPKRPYLGGGFKYFLFSPRTLGKISNLTILFFRWVVQPPTRYYGVETSNLVVSEVISVRSTGQRLNESLTQ